MTFLIGVLCGVGAALAVRGILLALHPRGGDRPAPPTPRPEKSWEHTRNFLYYDGTVMPTSKEDNYE